MEETIKTAGSVAEAINAGLEELAKKIGITVFELRRRIFDEENDKYDIEDIQAYLDNCGYQYDDGDLKIILESYHDDYDCERGTWENVERAIENSRGQLGYNFGTDSEVRKTYSCRFTLHNDYGANGWKSPEAKKEFNREIKSRLEACGFTVHNPNGAGACPTATCGNNFIYIHPLQLTGRLRRREYELLRDGLMFDSAFSVGQAKINEEVYGQIELEEYIAQHDMVSGYKAFCQEHGIKKNTVPHIMEYIRTLNITSEDNIIGCKKEGSGYKDYLVQYLCKELHVKVS